MKTIDIPRLKRILETHTRREGGCLIHKTQQGRPCMSVNKERKTYTIARVIVAVRDGADLDESTWRACHTCDNKRCIRPSHIYKGSGWANAQDSVNRSQLQRGIKNPRAVLTEDAVRTILTEPVTQVEMAARYGVGQSVISRIRAGISWKHIYHEVKGGQS